MSAEQFWKQDPQLFVAYRISFIERKKREIEEKDYLCWLQGLYTHDGNMKIMDRLLQFLNNMFSKSKINKKIETYPEEPYTEKRKKEERKKKENEIKYDEYESSLLYFSSLKKRLIDNKVKRKEK